MQIKLNGPLINSTDYTMPYSQRKNAIGKHENLNLRVIDVVNKNTTLTNKEEPQGIDLTISPPTKSEEKEDVPGSFHNMTRSISSVGFGSFDATIGGDNSTGIGLKPYFALLSGNPLAFPLDHYSVDLFIRIPFKHVQINNNGTRYGDLYKAAWISEKPEIVACSNVTTISNSVKCDPQTGNDPYPRSNNDTFVKIHKEFNRNDFAFWAITFPILFIFFLLGTICFLEPKGHYLVARIAITLRVFAFVFTFDSILPYVKPDYIRNISTFVDFLLKLVLVAAIASTISSVIGYRIIAMKSNSNEGWINRVQEYNLYDVLAVVFVSVIIIRECVKTNSYHLESPDFIYPIIIIVGLGWGLLCQIIYQYRLKQRERRSNQNISAASPADLSRAITILKTLDIKMNPITSKLVPEGVSPADLSNAIKILHDANDSKASWSQFYIDDFATAKVKILHVGRGKFRIVDDIEGGKYVGRVVDASELF